MINININIDIDGNSFKVVMESGPVDDRELVRYDRQTRTVHVCQSLEPGHRVSLVTGLLSVECQRFAHHRAMVALMAPQIDHALREELGTPRRRGTQAYKLVTTPMELDAHFGVPPEYAAPRLVDPGDEGLIVRLDGQTPSPVMAAWGLDDSIADVTTHPGDEFWSLNVQTRRCLIPASSWFDLKPDKPVMHMLASANLFAFAGIWGRVDVPGGTGGGGGTGGETRLVFTILTTEPGNGEAGGAGGHGLMPVVLAPDEYRCWLEPTDDLAGLIDQVRRPWPKHDRITMKPG